MSTQTLIGLFVAVAVIGGGIYYVTTTDPAEEVSDGEQAALEQGATDNTTDNGVSGAGTLADLMALGQDSWCAFTHTSEEGVETTGEFYFDSNTERFRVDSTTETSEGTFVSHMLHTPETVYSWTEGPQGLVAVMIPADTSEGDTPPDQLSKPDETVDITQEVQYSCTAWDVAEDKLTPPSDIEFTDMQALMRDAMERMQKQMTQ